MAKKITTKLQSGTVVQAKYGVLIGPDTEMLHIQPAYGIHWHEEIQPKYGTLITPSITTPTPTTIVTPGVTPISGSGVNIDITYSELEANISTLKKSIETLRSSWEGETKRNIDTLNNSWVGPDCATYTRKLTNMDTKVQKTISALELLCSTYEKARDMIKDSQSQIASSINNMK